jgi:cell wall-associated NlpC family hydrolase
LAKKPIGRRRADVKVNVLEQFELRSRKSVQNKLDAKLSRAEAKAAKSDLRIARMLEVESSVAAGKSASFSSRIVTGINRETFRKNFVSTATFSIAAGLFAVFSLPAYAFSPEVTALAGFTGEVTYKDSQGLTVGEVKSQTVTSRAGAKTVKAADLRSSILSGYRSWAGLSSRDYLKNPPYDEITAGQLTKVAAKYVGVPYVFGGSTPAGFDCSGYILYVYSQFGIPLAHSVSAQSRRGKLIRYKDAQPGDLVVWNDYSHNGIFAGGWNMFHAPQRGDSVKLAKIYVGPEKVHFVRLYK